MGPEFPTPQPLDGAEPIAPAVVVLPAVAFEPPFDERELWLERLPIEAAYEIPRADGPLYVTADGRVAVTTTGLGKAPAATVVAAVWGAAGLDLSETYWLSAGIAGAAPARAALGSVVVADAILDWDRKHRWDPTELGPPTQEDDAGDPSPDRDADRSAVEQLAYLPEGALFDVDSALVELARDAAPDVELTTDRAVRDYQETYSDAPSSGPAADVGPTVTRTSSGTAPAWLARSTRSRRPTESSPTSRRRWKTRPRRPRSAASTPPIAI